jgi:Ca2+-binding RTX toxin-like protein
MAASASDQVDPPIFGTEGNDVMRVDTSVTFTWVPDPGNSYSGSFTSSYYGDTGLVENTTSVTGPSSASGSVTFDGVSSSEAFQASPTNLVFSFSDGWGGSGQYLYGSDPWSWNPATGTLDPNNAYGSWDDWIGEYFDKDSAMLATAHWSGYTSDTELGHWALAPDPRNVDVFGGAGDDTIYGGQGHEVLSGDDGSDAIHAGMGEDTVLGGAGSDAIWGGVGAQTLDGGDGNDTIRGGTGTQFLLGDAGNDVLWGGSGTQTLLGGAGRDTLWGGTGAQVLQGGDGDDVLHAGQGNKTLSGRAGRDAFVFAGGVSGHDVIADFRPGQDLIQVAKGINGLAIGSARDLAAHVSAGPGGAAVLDLGGGASVTLLHVSAQQAIAHAQDYFKIV